MMEIPNDDLKIYIKKRIEKIQKEYPTLRLNDKDLWNKKGVEMSDSAQRLFIWVKTAFGKYRYRIY